MIIQNVLLEPNSDRICLVFKSIWIWLSIELSQNHYVKKWIWLSIYLTWIKKDNSLDYLIIQFYLNLNDQSHFFFWNKLFFWWVYFLKFHYKLILLGHSLNKSSKISFHEIRKIRRDWIANVTKCIFGWFKQVDVFWRDDKKKGK